MSRALDRLAALASGTAVTVSMRPRSVFESEAVAAPETAIDPVQPAATQRVAPEVVAAPVAPPGRTRGPVAEPGPPRNPAAQPEPPVGPIVQAVPSAEPVADPVPPVEPAAERASSTQSPATRAPARGAPTPVTPVVRPMPAVARAVQPGPQPVPAAEPVPTSTRPPEPEPVAPEVDAVPPGLLAEHVVPALVDERVVGPTAVGAPSGRADADVVRIAAEPVVEQLVVDGRPQVNVHIARVEVRPPAAASEPRTKPGPDLGEYLAARREDRR